MPTPIAAAEVRLLDAYWRRELPHGRADLPSGQFTSEGAAPSGTDQASPPRVRGYFAGVLRKYEKYIALNLEDLPEVSQWMWTSP